MNLLKQLRTDQCYRIYDKVLIIERLWDGKGDRPYTLSLVEEDAFIEEQAYYFLFPFSLQGCINVTETGIKPGALYIGDYTYLVKWFLVIRR